MTIVIDGISYDVPVKVINRKADALYKYAERTEDGNLHSELIGVYFNFDLQAGMSANNITSYNSLWNKLTEATTSHSISLLGTAYTVYFANVKDEAVKDKGTTAGRIFRNLSFSVISVSPTNTP